MKIIFKYGQFISQASCFTKSLSYKQNIVLMRYQNVLCISQKPSHDNTVAVHIAFLDSPPPLLFTQLNFLADAWGWTLSDLGSEYVLPQSSPIYLMIICLCQVTTMLLSPLHTHLTPIGTDAAKTVFLISCSSMHPCLVLASSNALADVLQVCWYMSIVCQYAYQNIG